jgi:RING finger protein 113A
MLPFKKFGLAFLRAPRAGLSRPKPTSSLSSVSRSGELRARHREREDEACRFRSDPHRASSNPTSSMADGGGGTAPVCNFVRKPPKNIRKRPAAAADSDDEDGGGGAIAALRSKKGPSAPGKLVFSSTDVSAEPRRFQYESSRTIQASTDSRATATLQTETEFDRDSRAIRERQLKQAEETLKKNPSASSPASVSGEVYKGIHGYTDYKAGFRREHTVSSEKAGGSHGPLRASAHIRVSARFDYQPDICKDYKETGYCGYGDSCKFMHDRGDYKSGWQLEKEYEEAEKARKRRIVMRGGDVSDDEVAKDDDDDDYEEALPFACYICRQPFVDPVVTKCKHYFCEHCALKV